jgi:hypothetical protein
MRSPAWASTSAWRKRWISMLLIYGVVPKKFFKQNPAYWGAK